MTRARGGGIRSVYKGIGPLHRIKYLLKAMPTSHGPFSACTLGVGLPGVEELVTGSPQGRPDGKPCAQECKQFPGNSIAPALPMSDKKKMKG